MEYFKTYRSSNYVNCCFKIFIFLASVKGAYFFTFKSEISLKRIIKYKTTFKLEIKKSVGNP